MRRWASYRLRGNNVGNPSITIIKNYKNLVRRLFPRGEAWHMEPGTEFAKFADAIAQEPARVEQRALDLLTELDPTMTFEMLDNWERMLEIPDECTPIDTDLTTSDRRVRILQKLTTGGGQNKAFYKLIASQLGYDAEIFDIISFRDFRVGICRVGEALSNSTDPDGEPNENGWTYTFMVKAPAEYVRRFRTGISTVGERLVLPENTTLECVIRRFAPAHVTVLFAFGD